MASVKLSSFGVRGPLPFDPRPGPLAASPLDCDEPHSLSRDKRNQHILRSSSGPATDGPQMIGSVERLAPLGGSRLVQRKGSAWLTRFNIRFRAA